MADAAGHGVPRQARARRAAPRARMRALPLRLRAAGPARGLALAAGLAAANLAASLAWPAPQGSWVLAALGLAGLLAAPGWALAAAAYPPGLGVLAPAERAALALVLGLLALPLLVLAASAPGALGRGSLAALAFLVVVGAGAVAWAREGRMPGPRTAAPLPGVPGWPATLALAGGAFALAAALWALPSLAPGAEPPSLALVGPGGTPEGLPLRLPAGQPALARLEARGGEAGGAGPFAVTLGVPGDPGPRVLLARDLALPPRGAEAWALALPPLPPGDHELRARWLSPEPLGVVARIHAAGEAP